jgi:hypothetical protein
MYEDAPGVCRTAATPGITPDIVASAAPAAKRMLRQAAAVQAALVLHTWFTEITARGVEKAERVLVTT